MKTIVLIFVLGLSNMIHVSGQEAFKNAALKITNGRESVNFTMPREVNVRHYRVEASNDKTNFEVISTFAAKGNTMLAWNYSYELPDNSYKYYRIGAVGMSTTVQYSPVLFQPEQKLNSPTNSEPFVTEANVITKN